MHRSKNSSMRLCSQHNMSRKPQQRHRFFDHMSAAYYVTDNFKLSAGHLYTFDTHFLTLGSEYGFGLGGGRMAALFAEGALGEGAVYSALAGLRIYFGQHDKTLIDRHRQDDPTSSDPLLTQITSQLGSLTKIITLESEAAGLLFAGAAIFEFNRAGVVHPLFTR